MSGMRRAVLAMTIAGTLMVVAGCAATTEDEGDGDLQQPGSARGVSHVHAVDLDETTGFVHIATHEGILLAAMPHDGETVSEANPLGEWRGDAMGFTRVGDRLLVSGHPGPEEAGPGAIGLRESDLSGDEWTPLSLESEVDFHALAAGGSSTGVAVLAGLDSVSGRVFVSPDRGAGWQQGAVIEARSLAWNDDASALFLTTATGLMVSRDRGQSFEPVPDAPFLVQLAASPLESTSYTMVGIDAEGVLHRSADGSTWEAVGTVPMIPDAIGVGTTGALVIANTTQVMHSVDGGMSWNLIVSL